MQTTNCSKGRRLILRFVARRTTERRYKSINQLPKQDKYETQRDYTNNLNGGGGIWVKIRLNVVRLHVFGGHLRRRFCLVIQAYADVRLMYVVRTNDSRGYPPNPRLSFSTRRSCEVDEDGELDKRVEKP